MRGYSEIVSLLQGKIPEEKIELSEMRLDHEKKLISPSPPIENKLLQEEYPLFLEQSNLLTALPPSLRQPVITPSVSQPVSTEMRRWQIPYRELKFEQELGEGAFGKVFKGTYRENRVAIKVFDFRGKLPGEQEELLLKEADVMERLKSEYLVEFQGICIDERYCLVMRFCDGGSLRARLNNTSSAISLLEQISWAMQISYGLYQLHCVHILHRDLKSDNILLHKNEAKVADFGLSIVKSSSLSQSKKSGGQGGAGTIPWMAPELHEDKPNSEKTDVYSLGVVLGEIVTGKIPFAGLMVGQMISKALRGQRDPLPGTCPEVFRLMMVACCDLDPQKRPSAKMVGDQFKAASKSIASVPATIFGGSLKPLEKSGELQKLSEETKEIQQQPTGKQDKSISPLDKSPSSGMQSSQLSLPQTSLQDSHHMPLTNQNGSSTCCMM